MYLTKKNPKQQYFVEEIPLKPFADVQSSPQKNFVLSENTKKKGVLYDKIAGFIQKFQNSERIHQTNKKKKPFQKNFRAKTLNFSEVSCEKSLKIRKLDPLDSENLFILSRKNEKTHKKIISEPSFIIKTQNSSANRDKWKTPVKIVKKINKVEKINSNKDEFLLGVNSNHIKEEDPGLEQQEEEFVTYVRKSKELA